MSVFISVRVGHGHNVKVIGIQLALQASIQQLVDYVSSHSIGNPFTCMNIYIKPVINIIYQFYSAFICTATLEHVTLGRTLINKKQ